MNDSDLLLHRRLAAIADDAPTEAALIRAVQTGYQRRLSRRRWYAAASAAAVVLVMVGATTLLGLGRAPAPDDASSPGVTVTLGSRPGPTTIPLAADSKLTTVTRFTITSPVSIPPSWVSFDQDGSTVSSGPGHLQVNWAGREPTAMQTVDITSGTTGTGHYRGYLITSAAPALDVFAPGYDARSQSQAITVNGHPAQLLTAPKGSFDNTYATPAAARITWQLGDRRWIQVWAVGEEQSVLTGFAASITNVPTVLPTVISAGLTVKGYTSATVDSSLVISQMAGSSLSLCRPNATTPANASTCVVVAAEIADGGFIQGEVQGSESDQQFTAQTTTVDVGGLRVKVNVKFQVAWTRWESATIVVHAPGDTALSASDLAALAASVQLDPALGLKDQPNPLVESSLSRYPQETSAISGTR